MHSGSPHAHAFRAMLTTVVFGIVLAGCSSFSPSQPPVADSTFAHVLIDLHFARAQAEIRGQDTVPRRSQILQKHGVTDEQLQRTLDYYAEHPDEYDEMYTTVVDSLQQLSIYLHRPDLSDFPRLDSLAAAQDSTAP